ncbi:MAG TPA: cation-translocating P-type ATPase [Steroidobacteraceae bacterium]|nr:cation-translocating P-type ATPase [Steroidobacteraceae bacterium]
MTTLHSGLNSATAKQLLDKDGHNELPSDKPRQALKIIVEVISEPMFLLLLGAAGIYLVLGDMREALVLCSSIFIIIVITFVQEKRTEQTLSKLKDLTSPRALVMRDGVAVRIAGRDVVTGDIVLLREGDRVPADATLLESTALTVDESILTGESLPVEKSGSHNSNSNDSKVFSGSMIISGYGTAQVIATGVKTEIGKIGKDIQSIKVETSPLYLEVRRVVKWIATLAIALCIVVALTYAISTGAWLKGLLAGITVAMGVLPEEFPVVLTVFLAMGAWRIARHDVLTRRIPAIESLGAATILAVDKTGTLTENRMQVAVIQTHSHTTDFRSQKPAENSQDDETKSVLRIALAASERDAFDPMELAIHQAAEKSIPETALHYQSMSLVREYDLTPELLAVTHVWQFDANSKYEIACKGAPETVMTLCKLDENTRQLWTDRIGALTTQGLRVLGVAEGSQENHDLPDSPNGFTLTFRGLLCLADPIRATVPNALHECKQAGIRVVMITGDHAGTATTIAKQAGFSQPAQVMTCSEMDALDDSALRERILNVDVFARATPQHKLRLVEAFKANGEIIVMTGDGVNDAPALKAAHVGVAMGSRGTDVAREAAAVVLLNDDFASLVKGVRLGRRIYDNIQNAMHYLISVHIPLAGIGLLPVLFGWPLVFFPLHVLFLEFVIDPACSFVFEADPESHDVMQRAPRKSSASLFSKALVRRSILLGGINLAITLLTYYFGLKWLSETQARALCFTTLVLGNIVLMLISRTRHESISSVITSKNLPFWGVSIVALAALSMAIYIPTLAALFHFSVPPIDIMISLLLLCALSLATTTLWPRLMSRNKHQ